METHQHPGVKRVPALERKRNTYKSMSSTEVAISNQELKLMFLIGFRLFLPPLCEEDEEVLKAYSYAKPGRATRSKKVLFQTVGEHKDY